MEPVTSILQLDLLAAGLSIVCRSDLFIQPALILTIACSIQWRATQIRVRGVAVLCCTAENMQCMALCNALCIAMYCTP